jgi:Tetracyclin repressor-like, C-terminal domain
MSLDEQTILDEVAARSELDPLERLAMYVKRSVEYDLSNALTLAGSYREVRRVREPQREATCARRVAHERFITELIREAQRRGQAELELDPQVVSNCVFGTIISVYRWYPQVGSVDHEEIADLCSRFVINGIVGAGGQASDHRPSR